ncbi:centrosomal protein of 112 kDa isoform X2 [Parambassis ranga]|uniref:Centrosomal protein of 112 kDa isoform X2 n=1 Tax=Parambassis ranga TaxID=210632 RepID=A0A6P7IQT6_9TELE|nr:centrosomal protein of 112 kDa isoform X2 [Parambassis ranga]
MSRHEDSWEKLDTEFDHHLLDMKPYVLKHPNRTERQHCAQWIKKLCDPAACGSGLIGHKTRNMYARLLLHMLKRGNLELPFTRKPEPGSLKTLPAYMSIYFDEPLSAEQHGRGLPDWLTGELGGCSGDSMLAMDLLKDQPSSTPIALHQRRKVYDQKSPSRPRCSSPVIQSSKQDSRMVEGGLNMSPDDSDLEARLNSWNLGIENPRYLREKPIPLSPSFKSSFGRNSTIANDQAPQLAHSKETEMKIKVLEAKHQEEKLRMQHRHDADVEKILDRKNGEIEEVKSLYRDKLRDAEERIHKLEKKVQSVLRESQVICESKDKQIAELKKMSDQSADSLKNEWEKKLHAAVTEMEQEKFELQKKHTENIQELLDDTNLRLAKMESEHNARSQATERMVRELELRVKQQSAEVEKGNALRHKLTQEKAQLEIHIASISAELQEDNRRIVILQKEKEQQSEQHEQTIRKLQARHETDISHLHQEHALSAAKASEVMEGFEKTMAQIKQQLMESEHQRHQQVRDQEIKFQQEKDELLINCEKKILAVQSEAEKEKTEAKRKTAKLEDALSFDDGNVTSREMESQLDRARDGQRQQILQADMALEQFKKQVELSSERAYADMKLQMEKVEEDLIHSKSLRENQAKEFSQQLEALRQKYEQQMAEQRMQHEQERTRLQQQHGAEKDSLVQEHQREVSSLERQARAALQQHQQHTQEWRKRDGQTISDLEAQVSSLREELQQARVQHKQQMALLQEEEKQRAILDKASLDRLRSDMEQICSDLERSHQQEKDVIREKTNSRLKQIEKEYSQKLAKNAQLIAELQTSVCDSKEEAVRLQQAMEKQLEEASDRWDQERRTITHHADQANKALQEKVESLQRQLHSSEKKLLSKELEIEEKVTMVRQEYEEKIKGLMPAELRQELEDTITSLKTQVNFLQKTASLLQEDLDACRSRR